MYTEISHLLLLHAISQEILRFLCLAFLWALWGALPKAALMRLRCIRGASKESANLMNNLKGLKCALTSALEFNRKHRRRNHEWVGYGGRCTGTDAYTLRSHVNERNGSFISYRKPAHSFILGAPRLRRKLALSMPAEVCVDRPVFFRKSSSHSLLAGINVVRFTILGAQHNAHKGPFCKSQSQAILCGIKNCYLPVSKDTLILRPLVYKDPFDGFGPTVPARERLEKVSTLSTLLNAGPHGTLRHWPEVHQKTRAPNRSTTVNAWLKNRRGSRCWEMRAAKGIIFRQSQLLSNIAQVTKTKATLRLLASPQELKGSLLPGASIQASEKTTLSTRELYFCAPLERPFQPAIPGESCSGITPIAAKGARVPGAIIFSTYFLILTSCFFGTISNYVCSDFSIYNILTNSTADVPLFYKISATWSNHEGSLLLWCWLLSFNAFLFCISICTTGPFVRFSSSGTSLLFVGLDQSVVTHANRQMYKAPVLLTKRSFTTLPKQQTPHP